MMSEAIPESIKGDMREQYADGWRAMAIADFYGCELDTVCNIIDVDYDEYATRHVEQLHGLARKNKERREREKQLQEEQQKRTERRIEHTHKKARREREKQKTREKIREGEPEGIYPVEPVDLEEIAPEGSDMLEKHRKWKQICVENSPNDTEDRAKELYERMVQNNIKNESATAAIVYTLSLSTDEEYTQSEISDKFDVSPLTIRRNYQDLVEYMRERQLLEHQQ